MVTYRFTWISLVCLGVAIFFRRSLSTLKRVRRAVEFKDGKIHQYHSRYVVDGNDTFLSAE
jgi:hypothetical protein